jgi:RNase P subunit RPR2
VRAYPPAGRRGRLAYRPHHATSAAPTLRAAPADGLDSRWASRSCGTLSSLQQPDIGVGGRVPGMPVVAPPGRRGRRGRRTSAMIRIAQERISDLFALAESESRRNVPGLPDRYVRLARRIGMRYNVRLLPEFREVYCRGCSSFWVEGRTVRTRLRGGLRVRTCLVCGRRRRVRLGEGAPPGAEGLPESNRRGRPKAAALVGEGPGESEVSDADEGEEG